MRLIVHIIIALVVPVCVALSAAEGASHPLATGGDAPSAAELPDFLASEDAHDRAWAAYQTGQLGLTELAPHLRAALDAVLAGEDGKQDPSLPYLLDALIRLGDDNLAVEPMALLIAKDPWRAVILAARKPEKHRAALMQLASAEHLDAPHIAAVNLLMAMKDGDVLAQLLDRLPIRLRVTIDDHNVPARGFGKRSSAIHGTAFLIQGAGLPPPVTYSLRAAGMQRRGWTLLADGPLSVSYRRHEREGFLSTGSQFRLPGAYGMEWTAHLLTEDSLQNLPVRQRVAAVVHPEREPDLIAAIQRRVDQQGEAYGQMIQQLVAADHLSAEQSEGLTPEVAVEIDDRRHNKEPRLPEVLPQGWILREEGER